MHHIEKPRLQQQRETLPPRGSAARHTLLKGLRQRQPHLVELIQVYEQLGCAESKVETLYTILLAADGELREAHQELPPVSSYERERRMDFNLGFCALVSTLSPDENLRAMDEAYRAHPQQDLLSFATQEMRRARIDRLEEEYDHLMILAGKTLVDCISYGLAEQARRSH